MNTNRNVLKKGATADPSRGHPNGDRLGCINDVDVRLVSRPACRIQSAVAPQKRVKM